MALVLGSFETQSQAEDAIDQLKGLGIGDADVSLVSHASHPVGAPEDDDQRANTRVDIAVAGGAAGASGGFLLGPIGAVAGGFLAGGGLAAALRPHGVTHEEAEAYEHRLHEGRYVLAVRVPRRVADTAQRIVVMPARRDRSRSLRRRTATRSPARPAAPRLATCSGGAWPLRPAPAGARHVAAGRPGGPRGAGLGPDGAVLGRHYRQTGDGATLGFDVRPPFLQAFLAPRRPAGRRLPHLRPLPRLGRLRLPGLPGDAPAALRRRRGAPGQHVRDPAGRRRRPPAGRARDRRRRERPQHQLRRGPADPPGLARGLGHPRPVPRTVRRRRLRRRRRSSAGCR